MYMTLRNLKAYEMDQVSLVRLGRLLRERGLGDTLALFKVESKVKCTEVIRVVLHGGTGVGSLSLRRNRFPGGRCSGFWTLCDGILVLWIAIVVVVIFTALMRDICQLREPPSRCARLSTSEAWKKAASAGRTVCAVTHGALYLRLCVRFLREYKIDRDQTQCVMRLACPVLPH
jgi:hypothetical protein